MCIFSAPKIEPPPPAAQMQAMQSPKDFTQNRQNGSSLLRRRGLWATVFTGPGGIASSPNVTGSAGGLTGG